MPLPNLVQNGTFEVDIANWTMVPGSAGDPLSNPLASSQGILTAIDGTHVALVYSGGGSPHSTSYYTDVPVDGGVYAFSGWYAQTGAVQASEGFSLSVVDGEGTVDQAPATGGSAVWVNPTGQVTMESAGVIRITATHALSGAGSFWMDAVSLNMLYTDVGEDLYSDLQPLVDTWGDPTDDLRVFCSALGLMLKPVDDISRDGPNGEPGWSQILDLTRAKDEWLKWLGQWAGYLVPDKATSEAQSVWSARERGRIVSRSANRRATIALLREIIQEHLTATKTVIIQERSADAHTLNVYVYNSEIVDSTAIVQAAALAAKAYGLILVYNVLTGANYTLLQASNASYTIMTGKHANYNSVLTNPGL